MLSGYEHPMGWTVVTGPRVSLSEIYNEVYSRGLGWYGIFADDVVPETPGWDRLLIDAAGSDGMSCGNDPAHFVLGGELVREFGWVSLPGLDRLYIDTVWQTIAEKRGVLRRVPEAVVRHHHFSNGLALMDKTYRKHHKVRDRRVFEMWLSKFQELEETLIGDEHAKTH